MNGLKALLLLFSGLVLGCGGSDVKPNTNPMTAEEIEKMKKDDARIDDEERAGSGAATKKRK